MLQLILHLTGDFLLQNDWIAENKGKNTKQGWLSCLVHCVLYTLPFYFIATLNQMLFIFTTHFIIDKFRLAFIYCDKFHVGKRFGFDNWIKIYLIFMVDMCFHLSCNYIAIKYL